MALTERKGLISYLSLENLSKLLPRLFYVKFIVTRVTFFMVA